MNNSKHNIHDPAFVEDLFDRMSDSYAKMNYITSFGFSIRWRRQLVAQLGGNISGHVVDLMTGMGECWEQILKQHDGFNLKVTALDFSAKMLSYAQAQATKDSLDQFTILKEDVFNSSIKDSCADHVISGFGMKTFSPKQIESLGLEIKRMLKPHGTFSLIDVSVPHNSLLRTSYKFYLKKVIPLLGKAFLGNPDTYKMLGVYTEKFGNSKQVCETFNRIGLKTNYVSLFGGCATGVHGTKLI